MTKENKNWTRFENFAPKLNLNHNIYIDVSTSGSNKNLVVFVTRFL